MVHVFIVNPICAGIGYTAKLRERLSKIPDLNYYVFTIRSAGYEKELAGIVEKAFDGEQIRIYCCGGSGTVVNILNGLSDLSRIEIGLIPLARMGYLDAFKNNHLFLDVDRMINGDIMHVDYLKVNDGIALNSVSMGLDAFSIKNNEAYKGFRAFGKHMPYIFSFMHTLLFTPNYKYVVNTDHESYTQACTQIAFSNVPVFVNRIRYSDDSDITDGLASYAVSGATPHLKRFFSINRMKKAGADKQSRKVGMVIGKSETITVRRVGGMSMWCNVDGELKYCTECRAEVVRQGLKLVVPKGVKYEQ